MKKNENSTIHIKDIQQMFHVQTKLFADNPASLDYRKMENDSCIFIADYMHQPQFDFLGLFQIWTQVNVMAKRTKKRMIQKGDKSHISDF